ncbi:hypothetical protein Q7689_24245, partial [Nocardiopsis tropica]|nr:hypothetical protein [Nocardiopsis tropica]
LIQAGVLPDLAQGRLPRSDRWLPLLLRPGRDLGAELARAGLTRQEEGGLKAAVQRRLHVEQGRERLVVVIDQFEELLTHTPANPGDQAGPAPGLDLVEELLEAADDDLPLSVVLIMRNDFYHRLAEAAPRLLQAAKPGTVDIPAHLATDELDAIITRPAQDAGARFEDGLPARIIEDLRQASTEGRVAATLLPPLQLALQQLWDQREHGRLTHQAYERIGKVSGSLTAWCDNAMARLPKDQRPIAQRILTALVHPADEDSAIPATRRQVPLSELRELTADTSAPQSAAGTGFDQVLVFLSGARIITTTSPTAHPSGDPADEPVAELIHDALIRDWHRLRTWVDQDRKFQVWRHEAFKQAKIHADSDKPGDLLTGTALAEGTEWATQRPLPARISAFLQASDRHQHATARRSRRLNTVLAGLLVLVLVAGALSVWQWQNAEQAREEAQASEAAAQSRQLAAQSDALIERDPDTASLLAVHAYRTSETDEARGSLLRAGGLGLQHRLTGHNGPVLSVVFSPGGDQVASASADGMVRVWDPETGQEVRTLTGHDDWVRSVVFSPEGDQLASASADGTVRVWDADTGQELHTLTGHDGTVT